jgi:hypothetical protein
MTHSRFLPAAALLLAGFAIPSNAQVRCTLQATTPLLRTDGYTELTGDLIMECTGGMPTAAGSQVPQINLELFLNTNITSKVTAFNSTGNYSEVLLLVDEPNAAAPSSNPVLNCGQTGAPDNGASGPGVCGIVSTGDTTRTYDGTACTTGTYGCGRPNAFQARQVSGSPNALVFFGVPFDQPGSGIHTFRITNMRADAALLVGAPPPIQVSAVVAFQGSTSVTFQPGNTSSAQAVVAFGQPGLTASAAGGVLTITEGFASSWKTKNVATSLANSTYGGGGYAYNMGTNYPADLAQNVSGVGYNDESGFSWNPATALPSPNPPAGYGSFPATQTTYPLNSVGWGFLGTNTGISGDGVVNAGTRIAITFTGKGQTVTVPQIVYLNRVGSPGVNTGVMVLTDTDAAGAGAFSLSSTTSVHNGGTFVYEVLYADPFAFEEVNITVDIKGNKKPTGVTVSFAPFYTGTAANMATPTAADPTPVAVPRFSPAGAVNLSM